MMQTPFPLSVISIYRSILPLLGHDQEVVRGDGGEEGEEKDEHDHPVRHDHDLDALFHPKATTEGTREQAGDRCRRARATDRGGKRAGVGVPIVIFPSRSLTSW